MRHKQDVKLQDLAILNYKALLQAAFSQLNVLKIDVDPLAMALDTQRDTPKIEAALRILLGSDRILYLCIRFNDYENIDFDATDILQPGVSWIGDQILTTITETIRPKRLRHLNLFEILVGDSVSSIADLIKAHAATLERIWIHASNTTQTDSRYVRETLKEMLRAAMLCPNLGELLLKVELARVGIMIYAISLDLDEGRVATTLANLVAGPTHPGEELGWV